MEKMKKIKDVTSQTVQLQGPYVEETLLEKLDLATGTARIRVRVKESYYYEMLSRLTEFPWKASTN